MTTLTEVLTKWGERSVLLRKAADLVAIDSQAKEALLSSAEIYDQCSAEIMAIGSITTERNK